MDDDDDNEKELTKINRKPLWKQKQADEAACNRKLSTKELAIENVN